MDGCSVSTVMAVDTDRVLSANTLAPVPPCFPFQPSGDSFLFSFTGMRQIATARRQTLRQRLTNRSLPRLTNQQHRDQIAQKSLSARVGVVYQTIYDHDDAPRQARWDTLEKVVHVCRTVGHRQGGKRSTHKKHMISVQTAGPLLACMAHV